VGTDGATSTDTIYGALITGNTITFTGTTPEHGLLVGMGANGCTVTSNIITGTCDIGLVIKHNNYHSITNNTVVAKRGIYLKAANYCYVANNTAKSTSGEAFMYGVGNSGLATGTAGSTNGSVTVTVDSGVTLTSILANDVLVIGSQTSGISGSNVYDIASANNAAHTITLAAGFLPAAASGQTWTVYRGRSKANIIVNNIFDGSAGTYAMCESEFGTMSAWMNFLDYNCLNGGTFLAKVKGSNIAVGSIATLRTTWSDWSGIGRSSLNDVHSIEENPFLDADFQPSTYIPYGAKLPKTRSMSKSRLVPGSSF
jgi:hypothetical protein